MALVTQCNITNATSFEARCTSTVTGNHISDLHAVNVGVSIACGVFLQITVFVGLTGNVLVFLAVRRSKILKTAMNALLVNLAIIDMIGAVLATPIRIVVVISSAYAQGLENGLCIIQEFFSILICTVQLTTLVAISYERLQAITNPFDVESRVLRVKIGIGVSWTIGFLLSVLVVIFLLDSPSYLRCTYVYYDMDSYRNLYTKIVLTPMSFLVTLIILTLYTKMMLALRKHSASTNKLLSGKKNKVNPESSNSEFKSSLLQKIEVTDAKTEIENHNKEERVNSQSSNKKESKGDTLEIPLVSNNLTKLRVLTDLKENNTAHSSDEVTPIPINQAHGNLAMHNTAESELDGDTKDNTGNETVYKEVDVSVSHNTGNIPAQNSTIHETTDKNHLSDCDDSRKIEDMTESSSISKISDGILLRSKTKNSDTNYSNNTSETIVTETNSSYKTTVRKEKHATENIDTNTPSNVIVDQTVPFKPKTTDTIPLNDTVQFKPKMAGETVEFKPGNRQINGGDTVSFKGRKIKVVDFEGRESVARATDEHVIGAVCVMTNKNKERGKRKLEGKAAKRASIVIGSFLFIWLPLPLTYLVTSNLKSRYEARYAVNAAELLALSLASFTAALNPILYAIVNRQFKNEFVKILKKIPFLGKHI